MEIKQIGKISPGQDGAIHGSILFRFDTKGNCTVYDISKLTEEDNAEGEPIAHFTLDRAEILVPHSNAVCFGCEYYEEGDEYPLLYTNVYNNYARNENKMIGTTLVYRIQRDGDIFISKLVQIIEIGFTENQELWKAYVDKHGDRPYGNFLIDNESSSYWAFVMRSENLGTRYFRFDLPSVFDGKMDDSLNVRRVVLRKNDIREYFDCQYHRFIQGAALYGGKIYSTEGFSRDSVNRPAIRIIDLATAEEKYFDITELGLVNEPELIDFYCGKCFYSDAHGNFYSVEF